MWGFIDISLCGRVPLPDILSDRAGQASVHFIDINVYVYLSVFKHYCLLYC